MMVVKKRSWSSIPAAVTLVVLAGSANAADESVKEKAALCTPCHGETGISQTENTPSLAGQPDLYLQWQLVFFRSGSRKNEIMQPMAEQLSNEDVRNLGAYFASLSPPKASEPDDNPDLSKKGAQAAAGRRCASSTPTHSPERRRLRALPASAKNTCSKHCMTTSQTCVSAAAWRRWRM